MPPDNEEYAVPIPKAIARLNKIGLNPVSRRIAPRLPGFGVIVHRGRKSGRGYRTPVNVFQTEDGYVVALTYGSDSDWVRNVLAAGECFLVTRGRQVHLTAPRLYRDESRRDVPAVVRQVLTVIGADEFLELKRG